MKSFEKNGPIRAGQLPFHKSRRAMESVPYFTEENFHLVNLLNEITKGKIPPVESLVNAATRPSETGAAPSGSASPSMKSMILDFSDISKELKRSYEDLVIFYEEEHGRLTGQNGGSKKQTRSGSLTLLATPDDFDMEAKSLTRKFSNMQKIMQKCDDCDFRGIIEEISMRKAQQRFLGALKELFIVYEQLLQDETDSLDFLLITEDPVELLKVITSLAPLLTANDIAHPR